MSWFAKDESSKETSLEISTKSAATVEPAVRSSARSSVEEGLAPSEPPLSLAEIEKKYGTVRSALSDGTVIQGKLSFDTPVRIDGSLMGEVFSSSVLIVGPKGSIAADINVETLIVFGSVSGDIKARNRLELHSTGELVGNVETPSLQIATGAYFEGACVMSLKDAEKKEASQKIEKKDNSYPMTVPIVVAAQKEESKNLSKKDRNRPKDTRKSSNAAEKEAIHQ